MLGEEIGRFGQRVRHHEDSLDLRDDLDETIVVVGRKLLETLVFLDEASVRQPDRQENQQVCVDKDAPSPHLRVNRKPRSGDASET